MNNDLKIIKKNYGEKMMHLCRELFPTILDNSPGTLSKLFLDNFDPTHFLYEDIINPVPYEPYSYVKELKKYIYSLYDKLQTPILPSDKEIPDPKVLMHQAGYTLYECRSENDIQKFKKYYAKNEELCTFTGGRLKQCHVYFAIKDNADKLKRQEFTNPRRQDEYGTSVISIQFTKDISHTLSIKNRYNHTVPNPDATFSNNLDNIIPGLTESFSKHYGLVQEHSYHQLELPGYVRANDGKFYRYNYEYNNNYYCPNNIVINNFQVTKLPKEKYLIFDYFVIDLVNKTISSFFGDDTFPQTIGNIEKINIINTDIGKDVIITPKTGEDIIIKLNKYNQMISYQNNNPKIIYNNCLSYNYTIQTITMNNVKKIGNRFQSQNSNITEINLPNVEIVGDHFLMSALNIKKIIFPKLKLIGNDFIEWGRDIEQIRLPNVLKVGMSFLRTNEKLQFINLPKVRKIGGSFLAGNQIIKTVDLPQVETIGVNFCRSGVLISKVNLPKVKEIREGFLINNRYLQKVYLPEVKTIGHNFMFNNELATSVIMPKVTKIGLHFMAKNKLISEFIAPNLKPEGISHSYLLEKKL